MYNCNYSIGDRIVVVNCIDDLFMMGWEGTIISVESRTTVGIEFDKPFDTGHSCAGQGKDGYCRWCYDLSEIELVYQDNDGIEIEPDVDEITVLNTFLSEFSR